MVRRRACPRDCWIYRFSQAVLEGIRSNQRIHIRRSFEFANGSCKSSVLSFMQNKYIQSTYLSEGGDVFCNNPQLQDVHHCFLEFRSRIQQIETMEVGLQSDRYHQKQILQTTIPQLLFMNETFFPPGIPKQLRTKLTLQCGKEISFVQNAVTVFTDGLNLLFSTIDLLQQKMNDSTSEVSNHFMQNSKPMSKTTTITLRMKSNYRGISVLHLYLLVLRFYFIQTPISTHFHQSHATAFGITYTSHCSCFSSFSF